MNIHACMLAHMFKTRSEGMTGVYFLKLIKNAWWSLRNMGEYFSSSFYLIQPYKLSKCILKAAIWEKGGEIVITN